VIAKKRDDSRDDPRSKSNYLRRRRVARTKQGASDLARRTEPNGVVASRRRRV
jgi:hypothetical protein